MSHDPSEKKIIVDEDWKSRVEAEREAARHAEAAGAPDVQPPPSDATPDRPKRKETASEGHAMPPADFMFLIGTLYIQGAMSLGLMVNPATQQAGVRLDQAKHAIDLLAMLQEKTEGNRTPDESGELETALHELRMAYIGVQDGLGLSS